MSSLLDKIKDAFWTVLGIVIFATFLGFAYLSGKFPLVIVFAQTGLTVICVVVCLFANHKVATFIRDARPFIPVLSLFISLGLIMGQGKFDSALDSLFISGETITHEYEYDSEDGTGTGRNYHFKMDNKDDQYKMNLISAWMALIVFASPYIIWKSTKLTAEKWKLTTDDI